MKQLSVLYKTEFKKTTSHKFRNFEDLQFSFFYHWNLIEKKVPYQTSHGESISFLQITDNLDETIQKVNRVNDQDYKFICINDNMGDQANPAVKNLLAEFFLERFPNPSKFERKK